MRCGPFGAAAATLLWVCGCASGAADPASPGGGATVLGPTGGGGTGSNTLAAQGAGSGAVAVPLAGGSATSAQPPPSTNPPASVGNDVKPPMVGGTAGVPAMMPPVTPMAGAGAAGGGATGQAGAAATPTPAGKGNPVIPAASGECPTLRNSTITMMGVGGIAIQAGTKPAGPTAPMVFYWHGTGGSSGEYALQATAVHRGVIAEGGILVSFQNTAGGDLLSGTFIFGAGDFKIADQLVACAVKDYNVDPRRIYATGCSAGGLFSAAMAAERSNYMAAAAPNSGGWTVPVRFQNNYTPALMTVHGAAGVDVVVVDFSVTSKSADDAFKARGGFVINCDHGGFHCGGGSFAGDMWTFFKAHPYGVEPQPWKGGLPAGFNRACKIF